MRTERPPKDVYASKHVVNGELVDGCGSCPSAEAVETTSKAMLRKLVRPNAR